MRRSKQGKGKDGIAKEKRLREQSPLLFLIRIASDLTLEGGKQKEVVSKLRCRKEKKKERSTPWPGTLTRKKKRAGASL